MKKLISTILIITMIISVFSFATIKVFAIGNYGVDLNSACYSTSNPYKDYWGQCTWYAWGRAFEKTGTQLGYRGNANTWTSGAVSTPSANSVVVWTGGYYGHVAFVEAYDGTNIYISEANRVSLQYSEGYINLFTGLFTFTCGGTGSYYVDLPYGYIHLAGSDSDGPTYDDFHVGEIQSNQFTVMSHVTDTSGIREVRYAVWTENNGQDDIKWYDGHCTDGNDYYWARINFSDHKGEKGKYIIHMYAYDTAGNLTNPGISYNFNSTGPNYSDFHVGEFREGAFTILAKVTDINGISSVRYAVWTENNGQDDLKWYNGNCTDGNDYYWARVNFADHKNEKGKYIIHMYAYDVAGKLTNPGITFVFPETGPTVTNVEVSNVSSAGYTITCNVTADVGVSRVQFPTWTEKDGQDDIASEWGTNPKVKGTISGNTVTFRVNTSEHNREVGKYITHLYAYDSFGTVTRVVVPTVEVPNPITNVAVTDIDELGFTITCDIDTAWGPISKVEFATWTDENGQDDIVWHQGAYSSGKTTCRILTKDHNNAISGRYLTHIYVWDNSGHAAAVNQIDYPCLSFVYDEALNNPTEPSSNTLGDVDGDGEVTIIDATFIQRYNVNMEIPISEETLRKCGDVDGDGEVSVIDATFIQRFEAKIPTPYPIGEAIT